jgi:sugar phosphate permease
MEPDPQRTRRQRNVAFSLGAAAFVLAFFHRVAPGAISADLRDTYSASATLLGFIAAMYFYPYALMQLPSGMMADSVGPRRLCFGGLIVAGAGSILFGYAPDAFWLLVGRGLVGLGVAVAFVSVLKLIANWFGEHEFGTWVGMLMLLGNLGGTLATAPLAWATQHLSWRHVFGGVGVLSLLLALCIWLWVRDSPQGEKAAAAPQRGSWREGFLRVARNPDTWPVFFIHFALIGSYLAFAGLWAVPYLTGGLGMTLADATLHITAMILAFAAASFGVGAISDRMRRRLPLLRWLSVMYVASWLPWVMGWQMPAWVSYAVFMAMGIGIAGASLSWALAKELNPPELSGTSTSLVNIGGFIGAALFQPLTGWVLDRSGVALVLDDYRRAATLLAVISLVGLVVAFRIRETGCRNAWLQTA